MSRTLEILARLVAFPTISHDSNLQLIDWVESFLLNAGFDVTRIWSPDQSKAGLFARIGPNVDGGICLSAHTDVVPIRGQVWTRPAFELTDGGERVYGRGTTDMKGFLASALALAERISTVPLSAPLCLSISYDEEVGCVGIQEMLPQLKQLIGKPRVVIVGEPTSMQVAIGHKGKSALAVSCHGREGHSALAPNFVNAIHVASDFVRGIDELQAMLARGASDDAYSVPYSTVHIGKISGGHALNIVPSAAQVSMELRHLAQTPAQEILRSIEGISARISKDYPTVPPIEVNVVNSYPGLAMDPKHPVVGLVCKMIGATQTTKVSFGTEAGFFADLGLAAIIVGPGDMASDGHQPDESISKADLVQCDQMMEKIAADLSR